MGRVNIFDLEFKLYGGDSISKGVLDFYVDKGLFIGLSIDSSFENKYGCRVLIGSKNDETITLLRVPNPIMKNLPLGCIVIPFNCDNVGGGNYLCDYYTFGNNYLGSKNHLSKFSGYDSKFIDTISCLKESYGDDCLKLPIVDSISEKVSDSSFRSLLDCLKKNCEFEWSLEPISGKLKLNKNNSLS
ncbi:MAG: hypothetical protein PF569_00415 [Candidatus Woesearchaeota archaeon]|jgi:hypothetical protein|nr:hypothetical protein [Candidatus Woesearchaeota archaeon]